MLKGPKALLSSAIADALSEFFIIDAPSIESNLIRDAKIVLSDVLLKEQKSVLPKNSVGKSTVVTINGVVKKVAFTWLWTTTGASWVKDATLTIEGLQVIVNLSEDDAITSSESNEFTSSTTSTTNLVPNEVDSATTQASTVQDIKKEGGMKAYILKHVNMLIDSLKLSVVDFNLTIEMPLPTAQEGETTTSLSSVSIVLGGDCAELLSFGRDGNVADQQITALRQTLNLSNFYITVQEEGNQKYPILDPFSYSAQVIRTTGERFGAFSNGLQVSGGPIVTNTPPAGIGFHIDQPQIQALSQLGVMILAAPTEGEKTKKDACTKSSTSIDSRSKYASTFDFTFTSLSAVVFHNEKIHLGGVSLSYIAGGSKCEIKAKEFLVVASCSQATGTGDEINGKKALVVSMAGIHAVMKPTMDVRISSIDKVYLPGMFQLVSPIKDMTVRFQENGSLHMNIQSLEGLLLNSSSSRSSTDESTTSTNNKKKTSVVAPFPISLIIGKTMLTKENTTATATAAPNEIVGVLDQLEVFINPSMAKKGNEIALSVHEINNQLITVEELNICGTYPFLASEENTNNNVEVIEDLNIASKSVNVRGGHSAEDWANTFMFSVENKENGTKQQPKEEEKKKPDPKKPWSVTVLCPCVEIAPLKINIKYNTSSGIANIKETKFVVAKYKGKEKTSLNDVIRYYTSACMKHMPNFISNVEIFGMNIVDVSTGTYGALLASAITPIGAIGGVAAITAVDAVKGTVNAGKRGRKVDVDEQWEVLDIVRGMSVAANEATKRGALKRRGDNNDDNSNGLLGTGILADWAVGALSDTGDYVKENKSRLGGAGGAGTGMLAGMLVAGPVGAIVGGLLGGGLTKHAIDKVDDKGENEKQ